MSLLKKTPLFCPTECAIFLDLLRATRSKESQIAASVYFRKKLAACQEPPSELIETIIKELIDCLHRPSNELQLNAAWALTNLACGSRQETHRIIASGGVDSLMQLALAAAHEVRDQAIWALGNLAADCSICREHVRNVGLLGLLAQLMELPEYKAHDPRKIVTWCLANLLRGGVNDLELDCVSRLLSSLHTTITVFGTGEILCDAVWCVAYLIDHATVEGERIDLLFAQPALVVNIVALLKSDSIRALTGALRTVGNIITGTDEQTTAILDFGVLEDLSVLVNSEVHQIARECLWILSNIAAGTPEHVTRLFSIEGIAESIFRLAMDPSPRKRKEADWTLVNALMGAPAPIYEHLLSGGLAQILVQLLAENLDPALSDRALHTIRHSLQDRPQHREYTLALFRRVGLVRQILKIARNPSPLNDPTSELATTILQQHFGVHIVPIIQQRQTEGNSSEASQSSNSNGAIIAGVESCSRQITISNERGYGNRTCNKKKEIIVRIKRAEDC